MLTNAGIPLTEWQTGFDCVEESLRPIIKMIKSHSLIPKFIPINELVMDPETGKPTMIIHNSHTTREKKLLAKSVIKSSVSFNKTKE